MRISDQLANEIVLRNMAILKKNINIMDEHAIIIASGQPERINTYHPVAAEVLRTCKTIEVDLKKAGEISGVLPGINIPIEFENKIAGVVGITGDPEEIRNYGVLMKNTVELMLKQAFLQEMVQVENRVREFLIHDLLLCDFDGDMENYIIKGNIIGINLNFPMVALIINIADLYNTYNFVGNGNGFKIEKIKDSILEIMKRKLPESAVIVPIGSEQIVVLKSIQKSLDEKSIKQVSTDIAKQIQSIIEKKINLVLPVGIGEKAGNIKELKKSYETAQKSLRLGLKHNNCERIFYWDDMSVALMIDEASELVKGQFNKVNLNRILNKPHIVNTLKTFFECNFNVNEASKKLFIHRNTLMYRLNKVQDELGLSPYIFNDALTLYLAISIKEYGLNMLRHNVKFNTN